MNRKIKRKKQKSSEYKLKKNLLSKTVSPSHNKSKQRNYLKKQNDNLKYFEGINPTIENPLPKFPKTVVEKNKQTTKNLVLVSKHKRPKKISVKNYTKTKQKLKKFNKKKKVSHNERHSAKVNQLNKFEQKNNNIKILIKNEIINNNNNHYYNVQMQKPYEANKINYNNQNKYLYDNNFRTSVNESTPIYNMASNRHYIYDNLDKMNVGDRKQKEMIQKKFKKGYTAESKEKDIL
jgi:hypothetical protein